jgi:hypothetical protein
MKLQDLADALNRLVAGGYGDRDVIAGDEFQHVTTVEWPDDNAPDGALMRTVWLELGDEHP